MIHNPLTRHRFLAALTAAITAGAAKAQSLFTSGTAPSVNTIDLSPPAGTVITACAPVYGKFTTLCDGQCPTCGFAHGVVTLELLNRYVELNGLFLSDSFDANGDVKEGLLIFPCTKCRNIFGRPVPIDIWEEWMKL